MMRKPSSVRFVTGALLVAVLAATLAPAADAGSRNKGRSKGRGHQREVRVVRHSDGHGRHGGHGSTYVVRRSSNAGPVIAGFLGGLFLGATIANAAPSGYTYYDPYCEERFSSLQIYHSHFRHHRHPQVVRVIEVDSGDCARSYRYSDGKWRDWDGDNDRYRDDRDDRYRGDENYRDDDGRYENR